VLKRISAFFALALLSTMLAACGGKGDCAKVVDQTVKLVADSAAQIDPAQAAKASTPESRAELLKQCEKDGVTKKQERCVLAAKTLVDLNKCDRR